VANKLTKGFEDYLEAIYVLIEAKGYARTKDIAYQLRVSSPSVTEMLHRLEKDGLVEYERYAPVRLTKKGEKIAKTVKTRHDTLTKFFKIINVEDATAEKDACAVEHELSPETLEKLTNFVEYVEDTPIKPKWLIDYKKYSKKAKVLG